MKFISLKKNLREMSNIFSKISWGVGGVNFHIGPPFEIFSRKIFPVVLHPTCTPLRTPAIETLIDCKNKNIVPKFENNT
jgi:hypothetical protein